MFLRLDGIVAADYSFAVAVAEADSVQALQALPDVVVLIFHLALLGVAARASLRALVLMVVDHAVAPDHIAGSGLALVQRPAMVPPDC